MIKLIPDVTYYPFIERNINLVKSFLITTGAQALIQGMSLVTGILIIRMLPVKEYAYYTIANTILGTMTVLSDSGINNGIMAQGGKVWQDKQQLGQVLSTGLDLRRKFAFISLAVSIPILMFLLMRQGADFSQSLLMVLALIPAFLAALSDSILEIPAKLHQDIKSLQINQLMVSTGRLMLSCGMLFIFPFTFISLLANGIPRLYGNRILNKNIAQFADRNQPSDPVVKIQMLKIVRRIFPLTVYYAYSGQIVIWLVSLTGSVLAVAEIGALGRIAMILNLFSVLFATLIVPRFARLAPSKQVLLKKYVQILAVLSGLSILMVFITFKFPVQILWMLGKQYVHLSEALLLSMIGSCINLVSGSVYGLYSSRGWTMQPFFLIAVNVSSIVAGLVWLDTSTLQGVLFFNIIIALVPMIISTVFGVYKIISIPQ